MNEPVLRRAADPDSLVEGEYSFTGDDFRRISALIYEQAGIALTEAKASLVYSRLAKRLRALGLSTFAEYCALIDSPAGDDERSAMLNSLTTNVTRFYREPHHFDHLRDEVLRPAVPFLRAGGRMRLWSAACSSGQEPYSMALTLLSVLPDAPRYDVKILATDIDSRILDQARLGVFPADLVSPIPAAQRDRWMHRDPNDRSAWRIGEDVRSLVTFKELNLIGNWPVRGPFDAIFCRNVMIYFDDPTQERICARFAPLLSPRGRLYIGHSERVSANVPSLVSDGLTVYRRTEASRT
ncbi:protein-glutamate O-methyltransferase [Phenylobacterium sp.]|uniref:CheR family methyltransferase n=1 Tax=Phenylobacterium sp. TaxID=1871053 RepID=UPI0025FEBDF3|nr:protein-glutamate O-methyltransferase [Phenylobacterium sp.]MCA6285497.1 protein-glutamate O-methyltransferase [Phenylobacterium sp.]MCA6309486.1 protein-glutamate O-methyltransferase [Phenylobacterium sp.]MCA6323113.1 protein-glutamate O-methyltransferase [Phenylobacterium sp.]MCA6337463.1 protein-glutamate O-methyltransferase [Phenylobacterium sp.]MCA6339767.1 protein-glutamate O-methyltransferase [Phenylobacterium sp.]